MANDEDMLNDIRELKSKGDLQASKDLQEIFNARFIENNKPKAEKLKKKFEKHNFWWGNYW